LALHLELPADELFKELVIVFERVSKDILEGAKLDLHIEVHISIYKELKAKGATSSTMIIALLEAVATSRSPRIKHAGELLKDLQELGEKSPAGKMMAASGYSSSLIGGSHLKEACLKKVPLANAGQVCSSKEKHSL
jgi:hypothetical protein